MLWSENCTSNYVISNYPIFSVLIYVFCQWHGTTDCTFQHDHCRDNKNLVRYTWSVHTCTDEVLVASKRVTLERGVLSPVMDNIYQ